MFEAGESGAETMNFFGKIPERFTPLLTGFGLIYKLISALMQTDTRLPEAVC